VHDRQSVANALMSALQLYVELRKDQPPAVLTAGMPDLMVSFLAR
jgi:hypothetical protein